MAGRSWPRYCPTCLESFRCKQRAGNGKVDLLVASEMENERRPILVMEPKADNVAGEDQLSRMSAGPEQMPGLVFFLGDSAMRDDGVLEKRGIFGRITVFDILDAWRELGLPKSGKDWPKRIRPGRKRLKFAFELDQEKREKYREYGYRNPKHFFCDFASDQGHTNGGNWDRWSYTPHNIVLKSRSDGRYSWLPITESPRTLLGIRRLKLDLTFKDSLSKTTDGDMLVRWTERA